MSPVYITRELWHLSSIFNICIMFHGRSSSFIYCSGTLFLATLHDYLLPVVADLESLFLRLKPVKGFVLKCDYFIVIILLSLKVKKKTKQQKQLGTGLQTMLLKMLHLRELLPPQQIACWSLQQFWNSKSSGSFCLPLASTMPKLH